jgi:hypothetical protein
MTRKSEDASHQYSNAHAAKEKKKEKMGVEVPSHLTFANEHSDIFSRKKTKKKTELTQARLPKASRLSPLMDVTRHVRVWTANCARAGDPNRTPLGQRR